MNEFSGSSLKRLWAVVIKEFVQMRRDRLTFGMMVGIPLIQLVLFGFAINADPRHLPAGVVLADNGPFGRTLLEAMRHSSYYDFVRLMKTEDEADRGFGPRRSSVRRQHPREFQPRPGSGRPPGLVGGG